MNISTAKASVKAVLCVIALIVSSCQSDKIQTMVVSNFPLEEYPDTLCSLTPKYAEHMTNSLNSAGSYLVSTVYKSPYLFSVYDGEYQLVDTIVPKGHGDNEMMSAMYFGQWEGPAENPAIYVFELGSNKYSKLHIAPYTGTELIGVLPVNENLSPSRIFLTQDSTIFGINLAPGGQSTLFRYGMRDKSLTFTEDNPPFNPESAFYTSQCGLAVSKDGERLAIAYISLPLICLYDKDLKLSKKIFIGSDIETSTLKMDDSHNGFVDIKYVGDKMAALYMNAQEKNSNKLLVFDKDGNPLASYGIGNSMGLCFDERADKMISLVYDDEEGMMQFYIYKMPELLLQGK